jgi:ABC-type uncharacterized transport system substrate-binding protein
MTARDRIPGAYWNRHIVAAGRLMSYGTNFADTFRQIGVYTGSLLKGAKPTDLPVVQSTKFELIINLQTARTRDIEVPPALPAIADEVIGYMAEIGERTQSGYGRRPSPTRSD